MKKYIGNILNFNGGVVRMMNTKKQLIPHYLGGVNTKEDELTFISYEESIVNPQFLKNNNLRFLTREEVIHFFRGENIKGEKIAKPEEPKITSEEKHELIRTIKEAIAEREANGERTNFLDEMLDKLVAE